MKYLLLFSITATPMQSVLASENRGMMSQSVYLLELLVIAVVAIALILLTLSIAKSRKKIFKMVRNIREEMGQERAMLMLTMKSIKEKEEQITYMAHLLRAQLEKSQISVSDLDFNLDQGNTENGAKSGTEASADNKEDEPEIIVEVIETEEPFSDQKNHGQEKQQVDDSQVAEVSSA